MFDLGMSEMAVLGAVALIVVGPKDLPKLARSVGKIYAKMRGMATEFRGAIDQIAREAELDDLRDAAQKASRFNAGRAVEDFVMDGDKAAAARGAPPAAAAKAAPPATKPATSGKSSASDQA